MLILLILLNTKVSFSMSCDEAAINLATEKQRCENHTSGFASKCSAYDFLSANLNVLKTLNLNCQPFSLETLFAELFRNEFNFLKRNLTPENLVRLRKLAEESKDPEIIALIRNNDREKCKSKDYRFKLPPIRDQDSMGWCYGFTAADLLSFKSGKNISAMDLSISQFKSPAVQSIMASEGYIVPDEYNDKGISQLELGWVDTVLKGALNRGVCLEEDFPSQDFNTSATSTNLRRELSRLDGYAAMAAARSRDGVCLDCPSRSELADAALSLAPKASRTEAADAVLTEGPKRILLALQEMTCKNKIKVPFKSVTSSLGIESVQEQLNNGNIVSVSYNAAVLNPGVIPEYNHSSSIVGQKWNSITQQCEFLLRNSWGKQCEAYHSSYNCESDGHVWIPANKLMGATHAIDYIN